MNCLIHTKGTRNANFLIHTKGIRIMNCLIHTKGTRNANFLIHTKGIRNMNCLIHTKGTRNQGNYSWRKYEGSTISKYENYYIKSENIAKITESHQYIYLHI